jgi:hypothetical protein
MGIGGFLFLSFQLFGDTMILPPEQARTSFDILPSDAKGLQWTTELVSFYC